MRTFHLEDSAHLMRVFPYEKSAAVIAGINLVRPHGRSS